jgi:HNH endonuclease
VKRSPMPPRATPFPRTAWKRKRARPTASDAVLAGRRVILLQEGCRVCGGHRAEVCHHRKLRSQGGDHSWSNLVPLCWWHHEAIHRNPAVAHATGYIVLRNEDPRRVPMMDLAAMPTAQRLRLTRPVFDWRLMQRQIEEEKAALGPEWGTL